MGAIRTVKVNNTQKYLLTDASLDGGHNIQILARPTASSTLTEGAIVGRSHTFYLDFSINAPSGDGTVTAHATLSFQPIRDYICEVDIQATLYGGKQLSGTFSVKIGDQTLLSGADARNQVDGLPVWGAGLSLCFYVGKDHKLRALAQHTSLTAGLYGAIYANPGSYTTAELEAGAGTELGVSVPTILTRSPWGGDFELNYYRQSYYDGDTTSGITQWETPWYVSTVGALYMTVSLQGGTTWRVPYNTYLN